MSTVGYKSRKEWVEALHQELAQYFSKDNHADLTIFIQELFQHTALRELSQYKLTELSSMVVSLWQLLNEKKTAKASIEVLKPQVEEFDWQAQRTIVAVLHNDLPFIIDSVRLALTDLELNIHAVFYGNYSVLRDKAGAFSGFSKAGNRELLLCIELDRTSAVKQGSLIKKSLRQVLADVGHVVGDFPKMVAKADDALAELEENVYPITPDEVAEAKVFIRWMKNNHFSFLAYDEYLISEDVVKQVPNSALGLFKKNKARRDDHISAMSAERRAHVFKQELLIFTKSSRRSSVHRSAYSDYVVIKRFNEQGEVIGGQRFMGLYTSSVYLETPRNIPVVGKKILRVLKQSGYLEGSHAFKELAAILYNFPRDELIQSSEETLLNVSREVLAIQERRRVRLFLRKDAYGKFLNVLVYMPRDVFNTQVRIRVHDMLAEYFNIEGSDFTTFFGESILARTRFVFKLAKPLEQLPDLHLLEERVADIAGRWIDQLQQVLLDTLDEDKARQLYTEYAQSFPPGYVEKHSARIAVADIQRIEKLRTQKEEKLSLSFFRAVESVDSTLKLKIFNKGDELMLSDLMPVLENFGLKVIDEIPYEISHVKAECTWIYDFNLQFPPAPDLDPTQYRDDFSTAFLQVWKNQAENDALNRLVLCAHLTWRQVAMLRAYAKYMKQTLFSISFEYIAETLSRYPNITNHLCALFAARFEPEVEDRSLHIQQWSERLDALLEDVNNINEDRIIRRYMELMLATLRTNFYQRDEAGNSKACISFKLDPHRISDLPLPLPKFEIYVYAPRIEGVHLRGGAVARGGLRWSDRNEDFRTEVLGLVKAQQVKNAVIVPVGAKGGFVAKQLPPSSDRDAFFAEGIECYKIFIRGLLDITDNRIDDSIAPPPRVVRHDTDDPYMVVAADKGTATFSDIANQVAAEYRFWLGDAFASGGSNGYDHKGMGITARGAWVSVQRHFRELGVNVQRDPIAVVAIGDMAGDVFGNGMLRSETIELVAAFNHLHIFIDPNPNAKTSYAERQRLFELPRSSWEDYDKSLISKGGGVFSRSVKAIKLSKPIQKRLAIEASQLTPTELIEAILKAPVDLIWNGGIGTYVKATSESHADIGDKANDAVRVNGSELRCKVIGEGGNLGFSQLGRIEFNLNGGRCFTDFIDNAGGVDCSDHEVNMKILLDDSVASGELTIKQRNRTLEKLTDDVADLVLANNYRQTQALGLAFTESLRRVEEYRRLINQLEATNKLNRELEFLPTDELIAERKANGAGLTRPELSVLICYVKGDLKELLATEEISNDPFISTLVTTEFPPAMKKKFGESMAQHRLRKEIIATQVANDMINYMGITFCSRLQESTGCSVAEAAKAYLASREIFALHELWAEIEALDYQIDSELQESMMRRTLRMVRRGARWIVKNYRMGIDIQHVIELFQAPLQTLVARLNELLPESRQQAWETEAQTMIAGGVPANLARKIAAADILFSAMNVIAVASNLSREVLVVAEGYFLVGEALELELFARQINSASVATYWQAMARESYRDDLEWQQRRITQGLIAQLAVTDQLDATVDQWLEANDLLVDRWLRIVSEIRAVNEPEFSMYSVAIRELLDLSQATTPEQSAR